MAIKEALIKIVDEGHNLSREEASEVMREIMRAGMDQTDGTKATEAQFGALMSALRMKGESVEEIVGMAVAMREFSKKLDIEARPLLDTAGTGGSGKKRFNASTAAAFVAAAGGAKVAENEFQWEAKSLNNSIKLGSGIQSLSTWPPDPLQGGSKC